MIYSFLVINFLYPSLKGIDTFSSCINSIKLSMDVMLLDLDCACSQFQLYCEHIVVSYSGRAIYIKKYLMQKKNYGNEIQIFDHAKM
jgi:hypothetical protein